MPGAAWHANKRSAECHAAARYPHHVTPTANGLSEEAAMGSRRTCSRMAYPAVSGGRFRECTSAHASQIPPREVRGPPETSTRRVAGHPRRTEPSTQPPTVAMCPPRAVPGWRRAVPGWRRQDGVPAAIWMRWHVTGARARTFVRVPLEKESRHRVEWSRPLKRHRGSGCGMIERSIGNWVTPRWCGHGEQSSERSSRREKRFAAHRSADVNPCTSAQAMRRRGGEEEAGRTPFVAFSGPFGHSLLPRKERRSMVAFWTPKRP
jgi:hypothetical protein